ncbi:MAG: AAA family ATPase [Candidatus Eremiobacteraeota bacterium]|nr:AAA family ATPase [Candidatus Eremiobacteraeota bacterium]
MVNCPACGFSNPGGFKFCGHCGQKLSEERPPEAERRQLSVMFFDLVGSTALSGMLDPEELRDLVQTYQEVCNEVVARYGGHVAQYLGDGILVYFGFPKAHPDDGQRAVASALSIIAAMAALSQRLERERRPRLDLRVGIHTGLVVVGEMGSKEHREHLALGETPNVAARLQNLAGINEVVFSAATHALVQDEFELEFRGMHSLKGVAEAVPVYRAVGWSAAEQRRQLRRQRRQAVPLLGREAELDVLRQAWEQAVAGKGACLQIVGEPGIGKSRLAQELKDRLKPSGAFLLSCFCEPEGATTPFSGMAALLRRELEFSPPELAPVEKLRHLIEKAGLDEQRALGALCGLLQLEHSAPSLSPQAQRSQLLQVLGELFEGLARRQPMLLHIDGFEWLDPSSQECLLQLAEKVGSLSLLLVFVSRRVVSGDLPRIRLQKLGEEASGQLVEAVLRHLNEGQKEPYRPDIGPILQRGHGVPMFLVELTRAAWARRGMSGLPEKLHEFLMSRVDELGASKLTAQQAATIGNRFSRPLVNALAGQESATQVNQLVAQGMVTPRANSGELFFVQNLMREACYDSLLKSVRQRYHLRLAEVFVGQFPLWAEQNPGMVAHHFLRSSQPEEAAGWLHRSLLRNLASCALHEAVEASREGLRLLDSLPAEHPSQALRLAFLTLQGSAWIGLRSYGAVEVEQTFSQAREVCRALGDGPQVFPVLAGLWALYLAQGKLEKAAELAARLLQLGEADQQWLRVGRAAHGQTCFFRGEYREAEKSLRQAVELYDPEQARGETLAFLLTEPSIASASYLAYARLLLGDESEAVELSGRAREWAEQLEHPHTLAHTYSFEAWLLVSLGRFEEARNLSETLLSLARQQSFTLWESTALVFIGLSRLNLGDPGGAAAFQQGLEMGGNTGAKLGQTWMLASLAQVLAASGDREQALGVLEMALSQVEEGWFWPELLRLKGLLLPDPELLAESRRLAEERGGLWFLARHGAA